MERLRVHKKEIVDNKSFISFISLIIVSHINKIMSEKKLYKNFTIKRLLKILATLKTCNFSGKKIVRSVTKNQKLIFKNFEISAPKN
jgi:transposase